VKRVMVRYTVKPELVETNAKLVESVFAQLAREQPDGIRYATFRVAGAATFVHVASIETADGANPLLALAAFREFTSAIRERCVEPPVTVELDEVGAYRLFERSLSASP
jgi:hypothetical protein